jgi:glycosyltransferase involved in cell wall biosynthesis
MQQNPLVTVVTVTYNSAKYIRDAVDSILHSSYTNLQLIIGDDSSRDDTWSIVETYSDPRIVRYRNETNLGEYANRNKAIGLATGDYLIFIDGDDMIYPHGLACMVAMLSAHADCAMALMHPYINWMFMPARISPRDFYLSNYFSSGFNSIAFTNTLFRTATLREFSGIPVKYRAGDTFIRLRIASKYSSLIIPDQLTWWRETPGQAFSRMMKDPSSIIENLALHQEVIDLVGDDVIDGSEKKAAYQNELARIKRLMLSDARGLRMKRLFFLIRYFVKNNMLMQVILSKRQNTNPFAAYTPENPLSLKNQ